MTFLEVLEKIEQSSDNTVDKGTQFERIQRLLSVIFSSFYHGGFPHDQETL